jgi:GNAT superfamily N-acetyltransferase
VTEVRPCRDDELVAMGRIINAAAEAYRGAIPADCWHEPYMSAEELAAEIAAGVEFIGASDSAGVLIGVMGIQPVQDVALIRHAYVDPARQGEGVGGVLLQHLLGAVPTGRILVGTWAAATWAIAFYERHGFRLVGPAEKDALLERYWTISPRQVETSVVLSCHLADANKRGTASTEAPNN